VPDKTELVVPVISVQLVPDGEQRFQRAKSKKLSLKDFLRCFFSSQRIAFQLDTMSDMDESVENSIGDSRVSDDRMPIFDRKLRSNNS
jgi:hypothetical protein